MDRYSDRSKRSMMRLWLASLTIFACLYPGVGGAAVAQTRVFYADLVPDDHMHEVVSPGRGRADFVLDLKTLEFSWKVSTKALTGPAVGTFLQGPAQFATNGLVFLDLAPKGMTNPLEGVATITEAQLQYMLSGWAYINVTTPRYRDGEIRGQIQAKASE